MNISIYSLLFLSFPKSEGLTWAAPSLRGNAGVQPES